MSIMITYHRNKSLRHRDGWRFKAGIFQIPNSTKWIVRAYNTKTKSLNTMSKHSSKAEAQKAFDLIKETQKRWM